MDSLPLLIACLSLGIAALSLGWQVAGYLLEGRRVRVTLLHGAHGPNGAAVGPVQRSGLPNNLRGLRADGFTEMEVVGITVTNIGRAPVTVERYTVHAKHGGVAFTPIGDHMGPAIPCRIPPGDSATWYADLQSAQALLAARNAVNAHRSNSVYMSVTLGTGDRKATKREIQLR